MTNPLLAVAKLVSTVTHPSPYGMGPIVKSALTPVGVAERAVALYSSAEGGEGTHASRRSRFVYGRVRWTALRMIIEWQTKQGTTKEKFAIYRGHSIGWREARLLDLSIFTTLNGQTNMVTYRAVDTTVNPPGPYYYWIVNLTAKDGERPFGPYSPASDDRRDG